ncbi:hypothetical protein OKW33_002262 [Paraburkholderia atlantica]|uniref:hypothetical protein n=1 Tax=Paraburkholderia atlantica TaxID=2654982 RepID=UPI003D220775
MVGNLDSSAPGASLQMPNRHSQQIRNTVQLRDVDATMSRLQFMGLGMRADNGTHHSLLSVATFVETGRGGTTRSVIYRFSGFCRLQFVALPPSASVNAALQSLRCVQRPTPYDRMINSFEVKAAECMNLVCATRTRQTLGRTNIKTAKRRFQS